MVSDWDTWEKNPYYQGPPGLHPEEEDWLQYEKEEAERAREAAINTGPEWGQGPVPEERLPF